MTDEQTPGPADHLADLPAEQPDSQPEGQTARRSGVGARLWSLRTLVATAVTAVALGGVGGAALAKASDGGSEQGGPGRGFGGPPGMTGHPRGQVNGPMNGPMNGQRNGQAPGGTTGQPPGRPGGQAPTGR